MALELSPGIATGLSALSLVPGAGAIAQGLSLAYQVFGESSGPRILLPPPFKPASFLWGVPRRLTGARHELSFRVIYSVRQVSGGAPLGQKTLSSAMKPGTESAGLPDQLAGIGGGLISKTVDPLAVKLDPTTQTPPYDLARPHGRADRQLTALDVIWAEALRRGAVETMAGDRIHVFDGSTELAIEIGAVEAHDGWWGAWTDEAGGKLGPEIEAALAEAPARRAAVLSPTFDDLDMRSWSDGAWVDRWLDYAGRHGADAAGEFASWKKAKTGAAAVARHAWEMLDGVDALAAYEDRADQWHEWRFLLRAQLEQRSAFDEAAAAWEKAWQEAVFAGHSFDQAAQLANETLALGGLSGGAAPVADGQPARPSSALPVAAGIGALLWLLL